MLWVRDGKETLVAQGESELRFLSRQSADAAHLLVMGRLSLPDLFELVR